MLARTRRDILTEWQNVSELPAKGLQNVRRNGLQQDNGKH